MLLEEEKEAREGPASDSVILVAGARVRRTERETALLATHAFADTATVKRPAMLVPAAVDFRNADERNTEENILKICCSLVAKVNLFVAKLDFFLSLIVFEKRVDSIRRQRRNENQNRKEKAGVCPPRKKIDLMHMLLLHDPSRSFD